MTFSLIIKQKTNLSIESVLFKIATPDPLSSFIIIKFLLDLSFLGGFSRFPSQCPLYVVFAASKLVTVVN